MSMIFIEQHVAGQNVTKMASMAKLKAGRLAREIPDSCLQYWGGMGFTSDVLISRFFRYLFYSMYSMLLLCSIVYWARIRHVERKILAY